MVKILKRHLQLSVELISFMSNPPVIFIYKNKNEIWLRAFKLKHLIKIIKLIILNKELLVAFNTERNAFEEDYFNFKIIFKKRSNELMNNFRIVNYETKFLLVASTSDNISKDREEFWGEISGYHEHLSITEQNEKVKERTKWFSNQINLLHPDSVLELGCGSGRNLYYIKQENPTCKLFGIEINPCAVAVAKKQLGENFKLLSNSIYNLDKIKTNSIDVVYTSGVLMHIPNDKMKYIQDNLKRIAKKAIIHYELHGPELNINFHRYPRDYKNLYKDFPLTEYKIFDKNDFRNAGTESFNHSLLKVNLE